MKFLLKIYRTLRRSRTVSAKPIVYIAAATASIHNLLNNIFSNINSY